VLESYLVAGGEVFEWEHVRWNFYYVRIQVPSLFLGWLPVEITIGERTLHMSAGFSVQPHTNQAEAFRYLLKHNRTTSGFCFALDSENRICLVGRIPLVELDETSLDGAFGRIVGITVAAVRSYVRIGFDRT
jgi:hypothetical protein